MSEKGKGFTKRELAILRHWRHDHDTGYFDDCEFRHLEDEKIKWMEEQIDSIIAKGYWGKHGIKRPGELKDLLADIDEHKPRRRDTEPLDVME